MPFPVEGIDAPLTRFATAPGRAIWLGGSGLTLWIAASLLVAFAGVRAPAETSATAAALVAVVAYRFDVRSGRGPFTPMLPVVLVTLTSLTIPALLGLTSIPTTFGASKDSNVYATLAFSMFIIVSTAAYLIARHRVSPSSKDAVASFSVAGAMVAWLFMQTLSLCALYLLAGSYGGIEAYFMALSDRMRNLAGQGTYVLLLLSGPVASLLLASAYWREKKPKSLSRNLAFVVLPIISSYATLLATGNRMNMVVYSAALAYTWHRFRRGISIRTILAGVFCLVFIGLGILPILRGEGAIAERSFDSDAWRFAYANFQPVHTFGQQPAMSLLVQESPELRYGATYLAATTMLIPRALAPWKLPDAGEVATQELMPNMWYESGTGIQIGSTGEAILNFGIVGIPLMAFLFGLGMAAIGRLQLSSGPLSALAYALILPRIGLYLRGGFANVSAYLMMDLIVLVVSAVLARRFGRPAPEDRSAADQRARKSV